MKRRILAALLAGVLVLQSGTAALAEELSVEEEIAVVEEIAIEEAEPEEVVAELETQNHELTEAETQDAATVERMPCGPLIQMVC